MSWLIWRHRLFKTKIADIKCQYFPSWNGLFHVKDACITLPSGFCGVLYSDNTWKVKDRLGNLYPDYGGTWKEYHYKKPLTINIKAKRTEQLRRFLSNTKAVLNVEVGTILGHTLTEVLGVSVAIIISLLMAIDLFLGLMIVLHILLH